MKEMLAECEHDIAVIKRILKRLKKLPERADRDYQIGKWQSMLHDVQLRAAQIREYISEVSDDGEK